MPWSITQRKEWQFFAVLPQADRALAAAWWAALILRGILPAIFAIAMGALVAAVQKASGLGAPLAAMAVTFVLLQVLPPIHTAIGANLGDRTAAWLYDRLTEACVHPPGVAHLEDPELTSDLTAARDFDLGMMGPPLSISMDFIASGMTEMIGGVASAVILFGFAWWAPIVLAGAWLATHWLLRESAVWSDRNTPEVRAAQRDADYAFRLAVDPPASKELRLFGLAGWTLARFIARRTTLHRLQYEATRLRERPVFWSLVLDGRGLDGRVGGLRAVCGRRVAHRVRWVQLGTRWSGSACRGSASARRGDGPQGCLAVRHATPGRPSRAGDPISQCAVRVSRSGRSHSCARRVRPDDSRRLIPRDRWAERRWQNDARQASLPTL